MHGFVNPGFNRYATYYSRTKRKTQYVEFKIFQILNIVLFKSAMQKEKEKGRTGSWLTGRSSFFFFYRADALHE